MKNVRLSGDDVIIIIKVQYRENSLVVQNKNNTQRNVVKSNVFFFAHPEIFLSFAFFTVLENFSAFVLSSNAWFLLTLSH